MYSHSLSRPCAPSIPLRLRFSSFSSGEPAQTAHLVLCLKLWWTLNMHHLSPNCLNASGSTSWCVCVCVCTRLSWNRACVRVGLSWPKVSGPGETATACVSILSPSVWICGLHFNTVCVRERVWEKYRRGKLIISEQSRTFQPSIFYTLCYFSIGKRAISDDYRTISRKLRFQKSTSRHNLCNRVPESIETSCSE